MGRRGPQPKPTALSTTRGRGTAAAVPPDDVAADPVALEVWHRTIADLQKLDLWHCADSAVLARYCMMSAQWAACAADVKANGLTMQTRTGYRALNPAAIQMGKLSASLLTFERSLGFTPQSRARMKAIPPADRGASLLQRFISGERLTAAELEEMADD